jgi:enoyl-CoA hydratase
MMCDIILAADTARFGQPEITIGTIPGIGGTQRLTRLVGKTKAMELCLTGRMMDAIEAEECGLVTRVVPAENLREEAIALAQKIASFSQPVVQMVKEAVRAAENLPLTDGIRFERQLFQSTFDLEDQKEGMAAFLEKRKAVFKHK